MKVKVKTDVRSNYTWDDLEYGDVCEFIDSGTSRFIGMKVLSSSGEDFVLDFENSELYSDVENYEIIRHIVGATLIDDSIYGMMEN